MTDQPAVEDAFAVEIDVVGLRGSFERERLLDAIEHARSQTGAVVQAFEPGAVYGPTHIRAAAQRALRAEQDDRALARDLAVEIVCYAAGTTQIDEALATVGIPATGEAIVLMGLGPARKEAIEHVAGELGFERDDDLLEPDEAALDRLGITPEERASIEPAQWGLLVVEKVALLDALK